MKRVYDEKFEKGKKVAEDLRNQEEVIAEKVKTAETDVLVRIKELASLKEKGLITEDEFTQLKKKLIES